MQKNTDNRFPLGEEGEKEPMRILRTLTATAQTSAEEILPDYKGEIRRVLLEEAEVIPQNGYPADGAEKLEGNVQYRVYYLDGSDQLNVWEFSSPYEIPLPLGEGERLIDADVTLLSESVRAAGPRRITAKATLLAAATVCKEREENLRLEGKTAPETQQKELKMSDGAAGVPTEREYAEEAERMPGVNPSEVEIVTSGGGVRVMQAKPTADGILLSGKIDLTCILRIGEGTPYAVGKTLPFEELIPYGEPLAEGGRDLYGTARGNGVLTSVRADVTTDPEAEENAVLTFSAIVEYSASALGNRTVSAVTDAYAVGADCRTEEEELAYNELTAAGGDRRTVTLSVPIGNDGGEAGLHGILRTYAYLPVYEAEGADGGAQVKGKILFFAITDRITEEGKTVYSVQKGETEFSENVKISGQIYPNSTLICRVKAENASSVLNGDHIDFSVDLQMELLALTPQNLRRITGIETEEREAQAEENRVTVCYPAKGETLWQIAKRYGKSVDRLAAENRLTEEQCKAADTPASLQNVERLLIL